MFARIRVAWALRGLRSDKDETRLHAAHTLGDLRALRATRALIKALDDEEPNVRFAAARALGKVGSAEAIGPLVVACGDETAGEWARKALKEIDEAWADSEAARRAVPELLARLEDEGFFLRNDALVALADIGDRRAVLPLMKALEDPEPSVRDSAAWALGRIADPRALGALGKALREKYTRDNASRALQEIGTEAVDTLVTALSDEDWEVRCTAARALGEVGDERAVAPLAGLLRDWSSAVRVDAVLALGRIGGSLASGHVASALRDEDSCVRDAAAEALKGLD